MCSRYFVDLSPELRPIIEAARRSSLAGRMVHDLGRPVIREGEVRPTDIAPVIAPNSKGIRSVFPMIWGFTLPDRENTKRSQPLINARVETADTKPTFKECWNRRRCIIPASYYFEWDHAGTTGEAARSAGRDSVRNFGSKYIIQPAGSTVTWMAGLYRMENGFPCFTVLTRKPGPELEKIHDRMPLILAQNAIDEWIDPGTRPDIVKEIAASSLTDMIFEKAADADASFLR